MLGTLATAKEYKYEVSPMIGYNLAEGNLQVKDNSYPVIGLEFQINTPNSKISPEFSILYSSGVDYESTGEPNILRAAFNGVYTFDKMDTLIPFAKLGFGVENFTNETFVDRDGFFVDAGAGVKIPFTDNLALKLETLYIAKVAHHNNGAFDSNLLALVGLTYSFGEVKEQKKSIKPFPTMPVEEKVVDGDDDNDGVLNSIDECPYSAAGVKVNTLGCEADDDKDGVLNMQDQCPTTELGLKVDENGCFIDGDDDKDGVLNSVDICDGSPVGAVVDNSGCTKEVNLHIVFKTGSYEVDEQSKTNVTEFANFLKDRETFSVEIVGYTDSVGRESSNKKLSENRANIVRNLIIDEGISSSRVSHTGMGEADPVADNATADGRAKNRRIEAKISR